VASPTGTVAPTDFGRSGLLRWLVAIVAFPIGGTLGYALGGPAATVSAALISGLITSAVIGLGQALALGVRPPAMVLWIAATAVGLGVALVAVTAIIGQIDTSTDAVLLGAVSGLAVGAGQAAVLLREHAGRALVWVGASALAWAVGWFVTTGIGVGLAPGWSVYGLSGAAVSQVITGVVLWKLMAPGEVAASAHS
jgi:hypothetical protein